MKIGHYEIHAIDTGTFALDGGAMFGVVPKTLWEKSNPPDEANRIPLASRALLLTGNGKNILVDVGNGDKFSDKLKSIYRIDSRTANTFASLKRFGLSPEDISDVVLTHLHFDHAGGSTIRVDGMLRPAFPNALYYVQREHWDAAQNPTERDRASFFPEDFLPLRESGQLKFTDGEGELMPQIRLKVVHGHTRALQCPIISDGTTTLFYCADLVPTVAHVQLPWIMAYDLRPLTTLEEKRTVLRDAVEQNWIMFFEHDPTVAAGRVLRAGKGFAVERLSSL
jgi:glyoxylase-like metal-dependent hydrolase (beta-lactamase superfamily II)